MIFPRPLTHGSTIGIIAPSGAIRDRTIFTEGIRILHELGFSTRFPRDLWPGHDYLADTDRHRTSEFQEIWNDEEVDAIMAARGGYGCLRLAHEIFEKTCPATQKLFIGYSDISLLHNLINKNTAMVTYHGPVVTSLPLLSRESIQSFSETVRGEICDWKYEGDAKILQGNTVTKGISTGGNLSTVISTLGTRLMPDWRGKIVFLEDTAEPAYRIDRMLTQLKMAGMLEEVRALVLGDFSHGLGLDRIADMRHHEAIWKRAIELVGKDSTVWANFPIGHGSVNYTIPLGLEMTVDSRKKCMYIE